MIAVCSDGETLSHVELHARVRGAIHYLRRRGIEEGSDGTCVAMAPEISIPTIAMVRALAELGVPWISLHERLASAERSRLLEWMQPRLVVESFDHAPLNELPPNELPPNERPLYRHENKGCTRDHRQVLTVMCTSGTTGTPRAVALSRGAFVASAKASAANLGWQDHDRWLLCLPPAHVGGLSILTRTWLAGRCVVLLPSAASRFDTDAVIWTIDRHRVTLMSLVPTMLKRLLDAQWDPPAHLRAVLVGGASLSPSLRREARGRGIPLLATYGLTEACSQVATESYADMHAREADQEDHVGFPLAGIDVRLRDHRIQVRGPTMFSGFVPAGAPYGAAPLETPFLADGWYDTGDFGEFDPAGRLRVLTRRTDLIVTGGENVYPAEIEQIAERIQGIEACAFGVDDPEWGQAVGLAIGGARAREALAHIQSELSRNLASFKRPKHFALWERLPTTHSGKLDRARIREESRSRLRAWSAS